jgi:hypothetical protein
VSTIRYSTADEVFSEVGVFGVVGFASIARPSPGTRFLDLSVLNIGPPRIH